MKYIIIGGGPTGMALGYALSDDKHEVCIVEKDKQLGGSWNSQWVDRDYWSENSPRVLLSSHKSTSLYLQELNIDASNLQNVYGNSLETILKIVMLNVKYCTFLDNLIIMNKLHNPFLTIDKHATLNDWFKETTLTPGAKKFLKILGITINDIPEKTNLKEFIKALGGINIKIQQFKDPNAWHKITESRIEKQQGSFLKNTEVVEILEKDNKVYGVLVRDENNNVKEIHSDKVIMCCQSNGICNILKNSNVSVKNNWMNYEKMEHWCKETYYSGFGFQLHFNETIDFPRQWCWSCEGDWNVIILPVSKWSSTISKDNKVKTVWSCCVINMNSKSNRIGKTLNECSIEEALEECVYQINNAHKIPNVYKVTLSDELEHIDGRWMSKNTGFTKGKHNYLSMKGNLDNLFALGCFTENEEGNGVAHFGSAIDASIKYLNTYEPNVISFHNKKKVLSNLIQILKYTILLIIIIMIYFVQNNKKMLSKKYEITDFSLILLVLTLCFFTFLFFV